MATRLKKASLIRFVFADLVNAQGKEFCLALARKDKRMINAGEERLKALQCHQRFLSNVRAKRKVSQTCDSFRHKVVWLTTLDSRWFLTLNLAQPWCRSGSEWKCGLDAEVFERQAHRVAVGQPVESVMDFLPGNSVASNGDFIYQLWMQKTYFARSQFVLDTQINYWSQNNVCPCAYWDHGTGQKTIDSERSPWIRGGRTKRVW